MRIINVAIDKQRINKQEYDVLKNALTYNIQRIENHLNAIRNVVKDPKFIIITDEGRLSKMRSTAREMQRINFIPSLFSRTSYRSEIKHLLEDILPKESSQSYFIQLADMVSFLVSLYVKRHKSRPSIEWSNRVKKVLNYGDELRLLEIIKPNLNLKASYSDPFGVVYYPK